MKIHLLTLVLFFFLSLSQVTAKHKAFEDPKIATQNSLHSNMRQFGLKELAKKALVSHGVQFAENPEHKIHSVKTGLGGSLEVTFDADIKDVHGKDHRVNFVVERQAHKNWMGLTSYTLSPK